MKQTAGKVKKQRKKWNIWVGNTQSELYLQNQYNQLSRIEVSATLARRIARLLNEDEARKAKKRRKQ